MSTQDVKQFIDKAADHVESAAAKLRDIGEKTRPNAKAMANDAAQYVSAKAEALKERSSQLASDVQDTYGRYRDATSDYVSEKPLQSVLLAAAAGAGLMALLVALRRDRNR